MPPTKRQQNNKGSNKDISQAGRNDIKCTWDVKGGDMQKIIYRQNLYQITQHSHKV